MRTIQSGLATVAGVLFFAGSAHAAESNPDLQTIGEKSDFKKTGRYEEVVRLCAAYQQKWPRQVRCLEFGRTPEGRSMLAVAVSGDGLLDAKTNRDRSRPVLLVQGGIHAGEIDGKDAGFLAIRHLLEGRAAKESLQKVTVVFVPVFNVDGHERFGPNNRPNQIGPEAMGWRTTAQNLNLNRDYVKAEAPEMQAMLRLLNEWDPILYADLHVTDGAEFEHDISINVAPTLAGDARLKRAGIALRDALTADLQAQGSLPVDFYPSFVRDDDPASGFAATISLPRFSHEYWARRNRIGILVETHSWKDYKTRVRSTYHSILGMMTQLALHGSEWLDDAKRLDERSKSLGGRDVVLSYENTDHTRIIGFRGYRYTRIPSPISGALMTKYDNGHPEIWRVPLFDEVRPAVSIKAPRGGYIVPAAYASPVAHKLALHAIEFNRSAAATAYRVQTFRAVSAQQAPTSNEGRAVFAVQGKWQDEAQSIPAGSLFVPIAQPNAELAVLLFEPTSPDSLAAWGFFATAFERKEYMEAYVAEQVALDMLKKDGALRAEFERRLKQEPAFAASARARLDFFYQRHPSWDERFNLYPVFRVEDPRFAMP
jgi:hypothetical protein